MSINRGKVKWEGTPFSCLSSARSCRIPHQHPDKNNNQWGLELFSTKATTTSLIIARSGIIWIVTMIEKFCRSLVQQQKLWAGLTRGSTLIGGFTAPRRHHRAIATNHRTTWCKQSKNTPPDCILLVVFALSYDMLSFLCMLWKFLISPCLQWHPCLAWHTRSC